MTLTTEMQTDPFYKALEELYSSLGSVSSSQAKAWERFQERKLPTKRSEAFTYMPLRMLYAAEFNSFTNTAVAKETIDPFIYPESKGSALVFVDGAFSLELSSLSNLPSSVAAMALSIAEKGTYAGFLQRRFQQRMQEEDDPFALLTMALSREGAFVFIPPKVEIQAPIQCLFVTTRDHISSFPRLQVAVGAHARASFVTTSLHLGGEEGFFQSGLIDLSLDEASRVEHALYMDLPKKAWGLMAIRASLKKDSNIDCKNLSTGSKSVRQDYHFSLVGEGADAKISGLSWLEENHQSHVHVLIDHKAPHCTSHQFFKGVLSGISQSSFIGKILVRKEAQKTQAYQLNNNLLLTEGAIANSKPGLEILADDVKASHGATVSQLDDQQLFYLKTRGLSEDVAKTLLVLGFCRGILDQVSCDTLRNQTIASIEKYLKKQNS